MKTVTLSYAKGHWSEILTAVEGGQTVTITRAGKPIAYLSSKLPKAIQEDQVLRVQSVENEEPVPTAENLEPLPSGVLRAAPDAAAAFPRDERRAAAELEVPATAPKSTQATMPVPEGYSDPSKQQIAQPASDLARSPAPKPLTLADVLRASREP